MNGNNPIQRKACQARRLAVDFHFGTGFDPDVCSATKGLVRLVDNLGRTVDRDTVRVGVAFVVLDREHGFVTAGLSVALYDVLINVDALLHLSPSEKAVGIATGTGEVGDDDFIIVRVDVVDVVDVVVVAALDHLLAALEATAPVKVLVVLVAHGATYFS
jgi:hypothetical protein